MVNNNNDDNYKKDDNNDNKIMNIYKYSKQKCFFFIYVFFLLEIKCWAVSHMQDFDQWNQ